VTAFKSQQLTMSEHLVALCKTPYNLRPQSNVIDYLLLNGRAFVIFDGLDELVDTSLRRKVVEAVEGFAHLYPAVPILVTSRRVGYEEAPLDPDLFPNWELAEFDQKQVSDYADKWFGLDDSIPIARRRALAKAFMRDSDFVSDLRINPLMLSLMCGIYASENYIPRNRPDVYEKCALMLFERWDKQRGVTVPLSFDAHVQSAMRSLALWLYSDPQKQQGLTRRELVDYMTKYLTEKRFEDVDEAENAANEFIDFCVGRAWVLTDIGSNEQEELFGFTHRTFLEYFAASQLVRLNPSAASLFKVLERRLRRSEWDVVAQLALQILNRTVEDGADDFLALVLQSSSDSSPADRTNLISFGARALEFVVPRPNIMRAICRSAVDLYLEGSSPSRLRPRIRDGNSRPIGQLLHCSTENQPTVTRLIREGIQQGLVVDSNIHAAILLAIFPQHFATSGTSGHTGRLSDAQKQYWLMEAEANSQVFDSTLQEISTDAFWAAIHLSARGRLPIQQVLENFGPRCLFQFKMNTYGFNPPLVWRIGHHVADDDELFKSPEETLGLVISELARLLPEQQMPWLRDTDSCRADYYESPTAAVMAMNKVKLDCGRMALTTCMLLGAAGIELQNSIDSPRTTRRQAPLPREHKGRARSVGYALRVLDQGRRESEEVSTALNLLEALDISSSAASILRRWVSGEIRFTEGFKLKRHSNVEHESVIGDQLTLEASEF
jgi:hypothetical protein